MKVNFNKAFLNAEGKEVKENSGEQQLISNVVCAVLFNGQGLKDPDGTKKYRAYELMLKIRKAREKNSEVDIKPDEAMLIQEACSVLNVGGYGQIVELLNK